MRGTRRATRLLAAVALTATPVITTAATPVATAGAAGLPAPPVIKVVMGNTAADMTVDTVNPRQAGRVTFEVTTTTDEERDFQIARIPSSVSLDQVVDLVERGLETDGPPDLNALRTFNRVVTLLGGVNALPGLTASVTLTLAPGVYYLVDTTNSAREALPVAKRLEVRGPIAPTAFAASAIVTFAPGHRFVTTHLPADGTILVRNRDDEPHFMFLEPVASNATNSLIQSIFDRVIAGDESAFEQFPGRDGPATGTGIISPGYQTAFTYHLTPGLYDMACFWPDAETGMPHAFMGMHQVVYIG
jgi:hypothetical protein